MNCVIDKCQYKADFGTPAEGFVRCKAHAYPGDSKFPFESCTHATCLNPAIYTNKQAYFPIHCKNHKAEDDTLALLQTCSDCKYLFSNARDGETQCRPCTDKIYIYIEYFVKQYYPLVLDRNKTYIRLGKDYSKPLLVVQFVKQDKRDRDPVNLSQITDLARTIKRAVLVVLCNTGDYKGSNKKQSMASFYERLPVVKDIIDSGLDTGELRPGNVTVKRVFFDGYAY